MPQIPENSVDKFSTSDGDPDELTPSEVMAEDEEEGTEYDNPSEEAAEEPAIMVSNAQAANAGMGDAMPGDKFTVTVTVGEQNDTGWNLTLDPGTAMKQAGPSMSPSDEDVSSRVKGPDEFGLGIGTQLGQSPMIGNA